MHEIPVITHLRASSCDGESSVDVTPLCTLKMFEMSLLIRYHARSGSGVLDQG